MASTFVCCKCKLPVKLEAEIAEPSTMTFDLLSKASSTLNSSQTIASGLPRSKHFLEAISDTSNTISHASASPDVTRSSSESFVVLSQSPEVFDETGRKYASLNSLSCNLATATKLFDLISQNSDIDHPLCAECTDSLVEGLNKKLAEAGKSREAYVSYFKRVKEEIPTEEEHRQNELELHRLQQEEQEAMEELREAEREKAAIDEEIALLEVESADLSEREQIFWRSRNQFTDELEIFQNERDSVNLRYDHDSSHLERLQRTNVYNDTFCMCGIVLIIDVLTTVEATMDFSVRSTDCG